MSIDSLIHAASTHQHEYFRDGLLPQSRAMSYCLSNPYYSQHLAAHAEWLTQPENTRR